MCVVVDIRGEQLFDLLLLLQDELVFLGQHLREVRLMLLQLRVALLVVVGVDLHLGEHLLEGLQLLLQLGVVVLELIEPLP